MNRKLDTTSELELGPLEADSVRSGTPAAGSRSLAAVAGAEVGVWEMTTGVAVDTEVDEVFVVLSGSASVRFEDGEVIDLVPGIAVRLRAGEQTTWTVHQALRKIYIT